MGLADYWAGRLDLFHHSGFGMMIAGVILTGICFFLWPLFKGMDEEGDNVFGIKAETIAWIAAACLIVGTLLYLFCPTKEEFMY